MSLGESDGGLPPDSVVEDEDFILQDSDGPSRPYHDPSPARWCVSSSRRAPPSRVTPDLMREAAALARSYGVHLHTHLAETLDEEAFCLRDLRPPAGGIRRGTGMGRATMSGTLTAST